MSAHAHPPAAAELRWLALARGKAPAWVDYGTLEARFGLGFEAIRSRQPALRAMGCALEVHPHLGVRWIDGPDILDLERIEAALRKVAPAARVSFRFEVGSTNDEIAAAIRRGTAPGSLALAETQTRGRGRRGRSWFSPPFAGLWFSLALGGEIAAERSPLISVLASLAAADTLRRSEGVEIAIRWPNDLCAGGRKLGGLLVERESVTGAWILGIGIDCDLGGTELDPEVAAKVTSLADRAGRAVDRSALAAALIPEVYAAVRRARSGDEEGAVARWRRRSDLLGRRVHVLCEGGSFEGVAAAVDPWRGLRVGDGPGARWIRDTEVIRVEVV